MPQLTPTYWFSAFCEILTNSMLLKPACVKSFNIKAGISICPSTDVQVLNPYLKDLDLVLIMSVVPGKGGQAFMESSLDKISYLDNYRKEHNLSYEIEVDGGINDETIKIAHNAGANIFVLGTAFFKSKELLKIESLLNDEK